MIELRSESAAETRAIAAAVAALARTGDLIVLAGQMGAGKTAFAQGFARELGVREPVTSPTYTLVHTYPAMRASRSRTRPDVLEAGANTNDVTLHHADLYRLEHTAEVADLALAELLEDDAIVLVEWGDKVDLGPHLQIELRIDDDELDGDELGGDEQADPDAAPDRRALTITANDRRWDTRWDRLATAVQRWAA